jgi:membrane-associated protease RseP (regulator of RpoE activity)
MFAPVQPTPYDLRFRVARIPVHVTPWFWLAGLYGGWSEASPNRMELLLIWIGCLFVSILIHELGHALLARSYGCDPEIYLYQFGGLAVFQPNYRFTTVRSVLVSLAGPGAGFVLYGVVLLLQMAVIRSDWLFQLEPAWRWRLAEFFQQMEWINLWWGLVNLLPVLPLDGGHVAEAILQRFRPYDGRSLAVKLSLVVAGGVAFYFFQHREEYGMFPGILFGILCLSNVQALQQPRGPW